MINKIYGLVAAGRVNYTSAPSFKADEDSANKPQLNEAPSNNFLGASALASYNTPLIYKLNKLDVEPIPLGPVNLEEAEGEKIYTSEGKLHSIVKEDSDTQTVYIPDENDETKIAAIIINDKGAGRVVLKQNNYECDGTLYSDITKYSPETGKEIAGTSYINGEPDTASITEYKPKDRIIETIHNIKDSSYAIFSDEKDGKLSREVRFNKDKQVTSFNEYKTNRLKNEDMEVNFYNGGLISMRKSVEVTMPNLLGKEKLLDSELVPSEKFNTDFDVKGYEGEKSYYSNGALEKNKFMLEGSEITAYFTPDGKLYKTESETRKVTLNPNGSQEIEDKLDDKKTRTTFYNPEGGGSVSVQDETSFKTIGFDQKLNPTSYREGVIDENGECESKLSLYYDKSGMLESAFEW